MVVSRGSQVAPEPDLQGVPIALRPRSWTSISHLEQVRGALPLSSVCSVPTCGLINPCLLSWADPMSLLNSSHQVPNPTSCPRAL